VKISKITLGTVNFGMSYGLRRERKKNQISEKKAVELIKKSLEYGINCFDTSPDYGNAEKILGKTLKLQKNILIATKVRIEENILKDKSNNGKTFEFVKKSIDKSRTNLGRDQLDFLQIHSPTKRIIKNPYLKDIFLDFKLKKKINRIGVTVYTKDEALTAINSGWIGSVQIPYNLINQSIDQNILKTAKKKGVFVFSRSSFLKGVLTDKIEILPKELEKVKYKIIRNLIKLNMEINDLNNLAPRFVLSNKYIGSVVFGFDNISQLKEITKLQKYKMTSEFVKRLRIFNDKSRLTDPRLWPFI
tara:strand:- start:17435 stop:18343 length:909 start_codon:yes stop_codon:yes gene_type:complete